MTPEAINLPNLLFETISTWIYTDYYHLKSFKFEPWTSSLLKICFDRVKAWFGLVFLKLWVRSIFILVRPRMVLSDWARKCKDRLNSVRESSPWEKQSVEKQPLLSSKRIFQNKSQNSTFYLWFHLKVQFLSEFEFALYRHFVLSSLSVNFWTEICRQLGARQSENTFDLIGLLRFSAVSLKSLHISTN